MPKLVSLLTIVIALIKGCDRNCKVNNSRQNDNNYYFQKSLMASPENLSIYCVTWNVKGESPKSDLRNLLLNDHSRLQATDDTQYEYPDVYVIGLQEVPILASSIVFREPWTQSFDSTLKSLDYVRLKSIRLIGVLLLVYTKRNLMPKFRSVKTEYTRTGFGGLWGNKGGVTVRFLYKGVSLCLVNSHLAAHYEQLEQRISDYNSIIDGQKFYGEEKTPNILSHDFVIWIGDLNFRIDHYSGDEINEKILEYHKQYNKTGFNPLIELFDKDQLKQVRVNGRAFSEFQEKVPFFAPTYKFFVNSDNYDYKSRKPAWTDRILNRFTRNAYNNVVLDLEQLNYKSHPQYKQSDHKPVSALFVVSIADISKLSRGERSVVDSSVSPLSSEEITVTFLPITNWKVNRDSSAWYTVSPSDGNTFAKLSNWDWIGLYRSDFMSIDEHIAFVWANPKPSRKTPPQLRLQPQAPNVSSSSSSSSSGEDSADENRRQRLSIPRQTWFTVTLSDQNLLIADRYRLVYVTQHGNVLGMSEPFEVRN